MTYIECLLRKGKRKKIVWIPEELAVVGKILVLKGRESPDYDWEVHLVGSRKKEK